MIMLLMRDRGGDREREREEPYQNIIITIIIIPADAEEQKLHGEGVERKRLILIKN